MPWYNAQAFLREAVESILAQSFTDFELIIVEDGSTDNDKKTIKRLAPKTKRNILRT